MSTDVSCNILCACGSGSCVLVKCISSHCCLTFLTVSSGTGCTVSMSPSNMTSLNPHGDPSHTLKLILGIRYIWSLLCHCKEIDPSQKIAYLAIMLGPTNGQLFGNTNYIHTKQHKMIVGKLSNACCFLPKVVFILQRRITLQGMYRTCSLERNKTNQMPWYVS